MVYVSRYVSKIIMLTTSVEAICFNYRPKKDNTFEEKHFYRVCSNFVTYEITFHIFLLPLSQFRASNGNEGHFEHKGVIEIIFIREILAKFQKSRR